MIDMKRVRNYLDDLGNYSLGRAAILILRREINNHPLTTFMIEPSKIFNGQKYENILKVSTSCSDMNENIRLGQNNIPHRLSMTLPYIPFSKIGKITVNLNNFDDIAKKILNKEDYDNLKKQHPNDFKIQSKKPTSVISNRFNI